MNKTFSRSKKRPKMTLTKVSLIIMRTFVLFIASGLTSVYANSPYAHKKLDINVQNLTIEELFKEIQNKSEYIFLYKDGVLDDHHKVSLNLKGTQLEDILNKSFSNTVLDYTITDRQVVIKKKKIKVAEKNVDQNFLVSGVINDENGQSIPGATVLEKGTTNAVQTDFNGKFSLKVRSEKAVLVISYIGFATQEIRVNYRTTISVNLKETVSSLDEVVVVGYGTQRKVSVTGAISSVGTDILKRSPAPNLVGALTGRLPGLTVMQSSGQPGKEDFDIYLRGASTLNGKSPLILVDGVPRDNITMLDPNEIMDVSILKDASATAVFGVRGANGVILITTRMGTVGEPQLSFSASFGRQDFSTDYKKYNSWEQAALVNQSYKNDGLALPYSQRQIDNYKNQVSDYYPNTDWFAVYFKQFAPQSRYNANLSGGTERVKYFINLGFTQQGSVVKIEDKDVLGYDASFRLNRYNFRSNLDIKANDWIKVGIKLAGYINKVNEPNSFNNTYGSAYNYFGRVFNQQSTTPGPFVTDQMVQDYGLVPNTLMGGQESLYGEINNQGFHRSDQSTLNATTSLDFDLGWMVKGLSSNVQVSFDTDNQTEVFGKMGNGFNAGYNLYTYGNNEEVDPITGEGHDIITFIQASDFGNHKINTNKSYAFSYKLNAQWRINYKRIFAKKHHVGFMALMQRDNKEIKSGSSMFLLPYNVIGLASRASYAYEDRYMAEFNIGYNGSEQFAKGRRFGVFPAGSVGWMVTNEKFMKNFNFLSKLKFRASYGKVGSDNIGGKRFLYMDMNQIAGNGQNNNIGNGNTVNESQIGNLDLTWEIAYKQNYGVDLGFFKNKLTLGLDYYKERRENILIGRNSVSTIIGVPTAIMPKVNMGRVDNHGYEIELGYKNRLNKDLYISAKTSFSYNKNTVIESDELDKGSTFAYGYNQEGFSIGQNFGYNIDWNSPGKGYFLSQSEIDSYAQYNGVQPRVGDFVYKDIAGAVDANGNTIADGIIDSKDVSPIGKPSLPRYNYSLSLNVNYKNFDISALFQGIGNSYNYYDGYGINQAQTLSFQKVHEHAFNPDMVETNADGQLYYAGGAITYPALSTKNNNSSVSRNDFFIANRRFIRLKNFQIGYTLPKKWSKSIGMQEFRFYASGLNLLTWSKLPFDQVDPEQRSASSVMPIQRTISVGANIRF
ncbi:TonB-dependent receptor [Flavobacterium ovatum]|uniref:SusC/RagA family TonB-linked outer membrane protein n=1 Tax=Flavobacterium ovatum TaxID=1928857 RepID=UPI00344C1014